MPKDKKEDKGIVTSALPIPQTESPLVIDLPDGQKIVLGKISAGAVIEVATWRGTGRPDSRTNRIMLGMSDTSSLNSTKENSGPVDPVSVERFWTRLVSQVKILLGKTRRLMTRVVGQPPVDETHDLEIDAWIQKLSSDLQAKQSKTDPLTEAPKPAVQKKKTPATVSKNSKGVSSRSSKPHTK